MGGGEEDAYRLGAHLWKQMKEKIAYPRLSEEEIEDIKNTHREAQSGGWCIWCINDWPCQIIRLAYNQR